MEILNLIPEWLIKVVAIIASGLCVVLLRFYTKLMIKKIKELVTMVSITDSNQKILRKELDKALSGHTLNFNASARELKSNLTDTNTRTVELKALLASTKSVLVGLDQKLGRVIEVNDKNTENIGKVIFKVDRLEQIEAIRRKKGE